MRRRFLIALLLALSALSSFMLYARADSGPHSIRVTARSLLKGPKPEENAPDSEPEDDQPDADDKVPPGPPTGGTGNHHPTDKAAIGGGVIICGFVSAIFAIVFWYIRVTRRRHVAAIGENIRPTI